jgi:predicted alpha/beta-hydrolase family hydrolase
MAGSAPREFRIELDGGTRTTALLYAAESEAKRPSTLVLAHGAGAGQHHPFMTAFARGLSRRGVDVFTFNFVYTELKRRVPDKMPQLVACYRGVIAAVGEQLPSALERLFIGGKSMGGRAATHVAVEYPSLPISGLVLLGYPLHPPGRPDKMRDAHLPSVRRPMLFLQGSRDPFGTPSELKPVLSSLDPIPTLHTVQEGDHSFKVSGRSSAQKQAAIYEEVTDTIAEWMRYTP